MLTCIRLSFVWFSQAPHSLRASMRACRQNGGILRATAVPGRFLHCSVYTRQEAGQGGFA